MKTLTVRPSDLPPRPDFGSNGKTIKLRTNFFPIKIPKMTFYEYDIAIAPSTTVRRLKRRIFQLAEQTSDWTQHGLAGGVAHDHSSKLISVKKLPQPLVIKILYSDEDEVQSKKTKEYTLTFTFVKDLDTSNLLDFLSGQDRAYDTLPIISALNLVMSAHPSSSGGQGVLVGRNRFFFRSAMPPASLGGGLEAWKGFYSSVRPAWKQLMVNVNVCTTAFYTPGNLAHAMAAFQNASFGARAAAFVRGVRVKTTHLGYRKTVKRLHTLNAKQYKFDTEEYGKVSVEEYFKKKYKIVLRLPQAPLVDVGGQKANYLPPEVCEILPDQPYRGKLTDEHTAEMIKVAAKPPNINANAIVNQGLQGLGFSQGAAPLGAFGISVGLQMAVVPGRILPAPGIRYGQGTPNVDEKASWNLRAVKFAIGGELKDWAVLLIQDGGRDEFTGVGDPAMKSTVKGFADMCRTSGMRVDPREPIYAASILPKKVFEDPIRKAAISVIRETIVKGYPRKPSMILVILSNGDKNIYNGIKHLCDVYLKVPTICTQSGKIRKGSPQYFANVALKMNMKMGGVNHGLVDAPGAPPTVKWLKDPKQPTMIVGMDVTHPSPGSVRGTPSIAAVVATIDSNFAQLPASLKIQETKKEMITELEIMMKERLDDFKKKSKVLPTRIIVYRDGVSEGQFDIVVAEELPQIKKAFKKYGNPKQPYLPKLSIVICGKRHHTRFFPTEGAFADQNGNPRPGTVVDRGVTAVYDFDFFLQAHHGLQGTVRPTHYYVVYDEIGFKADELQGLTNSVSYMFARATKAVSLAAPAYYADLACERGRSYLHSLFQGISESNTTTASGSLGQQEQELQTFREAEKLWNGGPGEGIKETMFYL